VVVQGVSAGGRIRLPPKTQHLLLSPSKPSCYFLSLLSPPRHGMWRGSGVRGGLLIAASRKRENRVEQRLRHFSTPHHRWLHTLTVVACVGSTQHVV
jgi:hypothetical protein